MGSFRRNEGKYPGMDGIWYLLKSTTMRNSTTESTVAEEIMKKPAIESFNLISKTAGSEENGLTISLTDYTYFSSRKYFNKNSLILSSVCVYVCGKCLFTPLSHKCLTQPELVIH